MKAGALLGALRTIGKVVRKRARLELGITHSLGALRERSVNLHGAMAFLILF